MQLRYRGVTRLYYNEDAAERHLEVLGTMKGPYVGAFRQLITAKRRRPSRAIIKAILNLFFIRKMVLIRN